MYFIYFYKTYFLENKKYRKQNLGTKSPKKLPQQEKLKKGVIFIQGT